jgi:HlyD family secretion protein
VVAIGRIAPKDGILRIAGPSEPVVVIAELLVKEGDWVEKGGLIARLDDYAVQEAASRQLKAMVGAHDANIIGLRAALANAESEALRIEELFAQKLTSPSERDRQRLEVDVAKAKISKAVAEREVALADLHKAEVTLQRRTIRAPASGRVLKIHARAGEKVEAAGVAELARTDQMYAIAEVYETDIARVHPGQKATVTSPALGSAPLRGQVERLALKLGKKDIFGNDPTARRDVRVIEVEVRLEDSARVAGLTNLQVEVNIAP